MKKENDHIMMGEINGVVNPFLESLEKAANPEEDLKKERIVNSFLASVNNAKMIEEFHRIHELFHDEDSFEDCVYKDVLMLN